MSLENPEIEIMRSCEILEVLSLLKIHANTELSYAQLLRYCLQKDTHAFVLKVQGQIVGVIAGVKHTELNDATIDILCVHQNFRRKGYARRLINQLVLANGKIGSYALDVRSSNLDAQALYRSWGFLPKDIKPHYYSNEDALTMILPLGQPMKI